MIPNNQPCDTFQLQHDSTILIIKFVGCIAVLGMMFCGLALGIVLWNNDQKELAVITALISTIGNAISLCIGVLIPSPIQSNRSRGGDQANQSPSGNPGDPVHVSEEASPVLADSDFEPSKVIPRGESDTLDPSYMEPEENDPQVK